MTDDDLIRSYRRWQEADAADRDDDADGEFRALFGMAATRHGVSAEFTAQTMEAVAIAAARGRRRARQTRVALVAAGLLAAAGLAYVGTGFGVSLVTATVTGLLDLLIGTVVRMAGAAETGADLWSVLASLGRAAAALVSNPSVTVFLFVLQAIAVAALVALQRLLGVDEESFK